MAKVILGVTMSVDGFINDREGSVAALYSDLETWRNTEPGLSVVMRRNSFAMSEDPCDGWQDASKVPHSKVR